MEERRRTEQQQRRREQLGRPPSPQLQPHRNNRSDLDEKIRIDLIRTVAVIREGAERRQEVLKQRKQYWKSKLNMLTEEQFKEHWKIGKASLYDYIMDNKDHDPTQRENSASVPRAVAQSQANANKSCTNSILQEQKKIAQAMKHKSQIENEDPRRPNSTNGVALKSVGMQSGSKRRRSREQVNADNDSDEEFQWEQNENTAENFSALNSEKRQSGTVSFVSVVCQPIPKIFKHPLPRSCECFKVEFLEPREYKRPAPRDEPIDDFGKWDLP